MTNAPYPQEEAKKRGITEAHWNALVTSIFPNASPNGILAAWDTAKAKGLDVMKSHVAVVQQSKHVNGKWIKVDTVWPTINALVAVAHRTNVFAGMDPIKFGPVKDFTYEGKRKVDNRWQDDKITIKAPESAQVCVYRLVDGKSCPFTEVVFFEETVPLANNLPNAKWTKSPRQMLAKCAKSAALRVAFPECDYSAEEMADSHIDGQSADVLPFEPNANSEKAPEPEATLSDDPFGTSFDPAQVGDPVESFADFPSEKLGWLQGNYMTAVTTGIYDAARSNIKASLEPEYQDMAEKLILSAQEVTHSPRGADLMAYIDKAVASNAYDQAAKVCHEQASNGAISEDVAKAASVILDFLKCVEADKAKAA